MARELEKGIGQLGVAVEQLIKEDEALALKTEKVLAIEGVGLKTVAVLLAETNGFATFESQGQLVSYSGYDIVENQSGKRAGKTRMSKKGNAHIRRAMPLPALGVVRWREPAFASLYERLRAGGKTKMQAYVAVQRKLLILIWALWRKGEAHDPKYGQNGKTGEASGNEEPKTLFSLACEEGKEEVAPAVAGATQDERQCNMLPEALFSLQS